MDFKSQAIELVKQMSTKQKISLFFASGLDLMKDMNELGIPCAHMAEGMSKLHLSKENPEFSGMETSLYYPAESTLAASFDPLLLEDIGKAMGEECLENEIDVLIGPRVNVKRSPLRGKGEKYMSEDPYLNGKLGAGFVKGLQDTGVAACIPALGITCREKRKATTNFAIDDKTLEDIYMLPFEMLIKEAAPQAFVTASGKMNGVNYSRNKKFIDGLVRSKWEYDGILASAPGTMTDPLASFDAGMDLELPGIEKDSEKEFLQAIEEHVLEEEKLDKMAIRKVSFLLQLKENQKRYKTVVNGTSEDSTGGEPQGFIFDRSLHRRLSWTAAQESAVLLKNNGILPLTSKKNIAIIGVLAEHPRFSDESVDINNTVAASPLQVFSEYGYGFGYARGYSLESEETDKDLIEEACNISEGRDVVIMFLGMPQKQNSDRKSLLLPKNQMELLDQIVKNNRNVVVVVQNDGIFRLPQLQKVSALLCLGIAGEECGRACVNLLSGQANPCGKLPESIPNTMKDIPSYSYFDAEDKVEYREGIYTGYRYYDSAKKNVLYPFGFGLSYTRFEYGNLEIDQTEFTFDENATEAIHIDLPISNIGEYDGKEVVQLYIRRMDSTQFHPEKELRGVSKIFIPKNESRMASFELTKEDFMTYSMVRKRRIVESGNYEILIGSNSRNLLKSVVLSISSKDDKGVHPVSDPVTRMKESLPSYFQLPQTGLQISDEEYEKLIGEQDVSFQQNGIFTTDSMLRDIQTTFWGNFVVKKLRRKLEKKGKENLFPSVLLDEVDLLDLPIYQACVLYCGLSRTVALGYIDICNHKLLRGLRKLV